MANPMVADLVARLDNETSLAIDHKNNDKDTEKIPLAEQVIGGSSKTFSAVLSDDILTEYGLTAKEIASLREVCSKLRATFVSKYGESAGFDSKRGTSIVQSLKSMITMSENDVMPLDLEDRAAIDEALTAWYENAPLRGRAANVKNAGKNDTENVPDVDSKADAA